MSEETLILTTYISSWFWHQAALIFLGFALVSAMLNKIPYILGLAFVVAFCEYMALKRQGELYEKKEL